MPPPDALLAFALASLVIVVVPGPSVLFVVGRSLSLGPRGGVLSVLGNELGALTLVAAVALGVGTVVATSVAVFTAVKFVGAAYLVYLGVQAVRHRRDGAVDVAVAPAREPWWRVVRQGYVVGATNPKTIVFFVAVLPQFTDFHAGRVPAQMMVLGLVFTVIAFVCDGAWALAAGAARAWFASSPGRLSAVRATGGGMMVGLGGLLAVATHRSA
ncbi:LysE family translocator [Cellulosimicrobium composti]|uniref:LysE family translocator n=1 Tax=Cellulosimicrobium composti TaxID=2672572 RepID=UPI002897C485|nr:LysE family translocator [Cellulosimicrobium composti]